MLMCQPPIISSLSKDKKTIANNAPNKTLAQQSPVYVCPLSPLISNDSCAEHNLCSPENIQTKQIEAFCGSFILWEAEGVVNFNALINCIIRHHHHHSPYHHHYISYILILSGVCVVWLTVLPCPPQYPPHVLLHTRTVYPHLWRFFVSNGIVSTLQDYCCYW